MTAAFTTCVYTGVIVSAIGVGLLSDALALRVAFTAVTAAIAACAAFTALWNARHREE